MASASLASFAALVMLLSIAITAFAEYDDIDVIHVTGKVLCQDCSKGWKDWIEGSNPIRASKVSITCLDEKRHRVMYFNSDLTDDSGDYDITIGMKDTTGKRLNLKSCLVRLVSSPDQVCNVMTNSGGGKDGVKLGRPSSVFRDVIKYNMRPFYYTTPMCDEPDTTEGDENEATNY
ncbi:hypothetical protein QQ045_017760 [Rhodiola kirilowii]